MNIQNLNKAKEQYDRLISIEKEIERLEELAGLIVKQDLEFGLKLSYKNTKAKEKESVLDSDGSLKNNFHSSGGLVWGRGLPFLDLAYGLSPTPMDKKLNSTRDEIKEKSLSTRCAVAVIRVLLEEKYAEKNHLINSLENLGVIQ